MNRVRKRAARDFARAIPRRRFWLWLVVGWPDGTVMAITRQDET